VPSRDRKEQRERSEDAIDRRPDDRSIVLRVSVSPLSVTCESDALHVLRLSIYLGRKHIWDTRQRAGNVFCKNKQANNPM